MGFTANRVAEINSALAHLYINPVLRRSAFPLETSNVFIIDSQIVRYLYYEMLGEGAHVCNPQKNLKTPSYPQFTGNRFI